MYCYIVFRVYCIMVWLILWNDYHYKINYHSSSHKVHLMKKSLKKIKKEIVIRNLRIYSVSSFHLYHTAKCYVFTMVYIILLSSAQFNRSVMSNSLWPHELQHARPPCPSPTPGIHPNSYPLSQWCHPAKSSSVIPFSSCPQSLPASESFPMSQLFAWGGQSIGVSASASFLPKKSQG